MPTNATAAAASPPLKTAPKPALGSSSALTAQSECLPGGGAGGVPTHDLLVLILSSRQRDLGPAKRREAVRESWATPSSELGAAGAPAAERCSVRYLFVVGGGKGKAHVWGEDVLVLPADDGYRQIAQKVLGALSWAIEHAPFKYVLKTDDDSFVCVSRLLELLRGSARERLYMGVVNRNHKVVTSPSDPQYERWRDPLYTSLFNRTVYADYMQGAGYVLSADLAALVVQRAAALSAVPAIEDALVGTLLEGAAEPANRPSAFRYKNRDAYALTVCEEDTEFVLLHKLELSDLGGCRAATRKRRSERCPRGPCSCLSLGHRPKRPRKVVRGFAHAVELQAARGRAAAATATAH